MTQSEYDTQRGKLIAAMTGTQSVSSGNASVTKRSIKEIQQAIQALDAEWQRQNGTPASRIGRLYIGGEGL